MSQVSTRGDADRMVLMSATTHGGESTSNNKVKVNLGTQAAELMELSRTHSRNCMVLNLTACFSLLIVITVSGKVKAT